MDYQAVTHLATKTPKTVYSLAGTILTNMRINANIYPNPKPTMDEFDTHLLALDSAMKAKDGTKLKNQLIDDCTDVLYNDIKELKLYVNQTAKGDRALILMSGFDVNTEPVKHDVPAKAIIKRIEDGSKPNSAKIYIESMPDTNRYKVESTTSLQNPVWVSLLDIGASNKQEVENLSRGIEIFLRVWGGNTHGWGSPSEPMAFIPR